MPSSEKTSKIGLTQFHSDDIPSWLQDYNADMRKVDEVIQISYNSFAQVNSNYTETTPLGEVFTSMADHSVLTVEITTAQAQYENLTGVLTLKRVSENMGSGSLMAGGNLYSLQITENSNGGGVSRNIKQVCGYFFIM